jgi:anti-anti-sigma factor
MHNPFVPDQSSDDTPPTVTTVALKGALDLTTKDAALAQLLAAISERHHVDVDMSAVTFMDSSALSMFIRVRELAAAQGLRLRLTKVRPLVQRVLQITGVYELLTNR